VSQARTADATLARLHRGLIVSCQAPAGSPMRQPVVMAAVAAAAVAGGAVGIRANGAEDIVAIRATVEVPIIGLFKQIDESGTQWITPDLDSARAVVEAACDIVAVDATLRAPRMGPPPDALIDRIRSRLGVPVLADVDSVAAGLAAERAGADALATTLSGYTSEPSGPAGQPDIALVERLASAAALPVIAEGRYQSPAQVNAAFSAGAHAVVIGTAITDPLRLTEGFALSIHRWWSSRDKGLET
jgi:putative N-acetylmannosamine-6-phosphate epimerase